MILAAIATALAFGNVVLATVKGQTTRRERKVTSAAEKMFKAASDQAAEKWQEAYGSLAEKGDENKDQIARRERAATKQQEDYDASRKQNDVNLGVKQTNAKLEKVEGRGEEVNNKMFPNGISGFFQEEAKTNPGVADALKEIEEHAAELRQRQEEEEKEKASLTSQQMRQALYQNVRTTKMFCEKYDSLEQQALDWQERGLRYRAERDEARTENEQLKQQLNRYRTEQDEARTEDKNRKIAALERQLASSSTS